MKKSKVPKEIIKAADRIIAKARSEGINSKILHSKNLLVQLLMLRYTGNNSEYNICRTVGLSREGFSRFLKRGSENPKSAYGLFFRYWHKYFEELERIVFSDLAERARDPNTPTKEKIEILRAIRPDKYRYDPTGKSQQGNQTLQITNNYFSPEILEHAKGIIDLPKPQRHLVLEQLGEIVNKEEEIEEDESSS
jgi:hypothetical protein